MSESPHYVRPRKLKNKEKFVFDSNEIVVTATNVQSKAQLRLSGRHRKSEEDNNNSVEAGPVRRVVPREQNSNNNSVEAGAARRTEAGRAIRSAPGEQNGNNPLRYELVPGVKNVKNINTSSSPYQGVNRQPSQVTAIRQPNQVSANASRQPQTDGNTSRQSHQSGQQQDLANSRKAIPEFANYGRHPSQERAYHDRQNQYYDYDEVQQSREEVDDRPVRRRHPAGSTSYPTQDFDSQPILPTRQGWSGGAQARLSSARKSATSISTISNKESQVLDENPRNYGRPLVAPSYNTIKDSGIKQRLIENAQREDTGFSGITWQDRVQYIEEDRWLQDQQRPFLFQERQGDAGDLYDTENRNKNHHRVVLEQDLERFQTLNIREADSANNNEIGLSLPAKEKKRCICDRDLKLVFCQSCLHSSFGRIRKQCDLHPKNHYLLDMTSCSACKKEDLKEYDIPANIDVSSIKNRLKKNMN